MLPKYYQFHAPTKILYGAGISNDFSSELDQLGIRNALIVSDRRLIATDSVRRIVDGVREADINIVGEFTDIPPNSSFSSVVKCAGFGAKADGLIAIGGGSVLDTAKAAAILITHGGKLSDYLGAQVLPGPLRPVIAVPTTSGTGSEVTQAAVILDEARGIKLSFYDQYLRPQLAVLDPNLTVGLPPGLTAATSWDALTHAIEALTSLQSNPFSDELAFPAIKLIKRSLGASLKNGGDIEARGELMVAATLAGIAFDQAMVGIVHAMAHSVGGVSKAHHGTLNFILLPYGMEYNLDVCIEKYAVLARALGVGSTFRSQRALARAAITQIRRWRKHIKKMAKLPLRLRDVGVKKDQLSAIAAHTVEDGTSFYNPKEVVKEEVLRKLEEAY